MTRALLAGGALLALEMFSRKRRNHRAIEQLAFPFVDYVQDPLLEVEPVEPGLRKIAENIYLDAEGDIAVLTSIRSQRPLYGWVPGIDGRQWQLKSWAHHDDLSGLAYAAGGNVAAIESALAAWEGEKRIDDYPFYGYALRAVRPDKEWMVALLPRIGEGKFQGFFEWGDASDALKELAERIEEEEWASLDFWGAGNPGELYHGTGGKEEEIFSYGLEPRKETRGLANADTGPAVYTTASTWLASDYGRLLRIDVEGLANLEPEDRPEVTWEEGVGLYRALQSLQQALELPHIELDQYCQHPLHEEVYLFRDTIPPEFLSWEDE